MSWANYVRITLTILLLLRSGTCYKCLGSRCICLDPGGCKTNCTDGFCQNKEFVCTKNVKHCSFNCQDVTSCQDSRFYMASDEFYIHCSNTSSCNNVEILCGIPPEKPPSQLTFHDFNNTMQTCAISASTASITNSYISCNGDIDNCYIASQVAAAPTVVDSVFDCSVNTGQCSFNCSYSCSDSLYTCDTSLETQCKCNECNDGVSIESITTTSSATSSHNYIDGEVSTTGVAHSAVFDLTVGKVSNLEILYYIIMGAGCCLVCCVCLCVLIICSFRSTSSVRSKPSETEENPKSPHSEYRVYGENHGSTGDRVIDVESTQSTNSSCKHRQSVSVSIEDEKNTDTTTNTNTNTVSTVSTVSTVIEDDMQTNMDDELSVHHRNVKMNHLTPINKSNIQHSMSRSPMSPLSAISSSNPDPHEGRAMNGGDNVMYAESAHSADSSELNLKRKSRTNIETGGTAPAPPPQQFHNNLMTEQFEQMMAHYANLSRGRSPTQFAVMQQQLLYIQQHRALQPDQIHQKRSYSDSHHSLHDTNLGLEMIKPCIHRSDTATSSNPTLPVIGSDGDNSDVITPSIQEDMSIKSHIYASSIQSSVVTSSSSSSSSSECLDEDSSVDQSDASCSCSDCIQNEDGDEDEDEHGECTKTQCLGDGLNTECISVVASAAAASSTGSSSSGSSGSSECNDTQCSCRQCTVSCGDTSSDSCSSADDTESAQTGSTTNSESSGTDYRSSSCTESDAETDTESENETETTHTINNSILSERKLHKKLTKKWKKQRNVQQEIMEEKHDIESIDTDNRSYRRGRNQTMVIHENMSTDNHSRQYTENSDVSLGLSTIESNVGGDHKRFRTLVIHDT